MWPSSALTLECCCRFSGLLCITCFSPLAIKYSSVPVSPLIFWLSRPLSLSCSAPPLPLHLCGHDHAIRLRLGRVGDLQKSTEHHASMKAHAPAARAPPTRAARMRCQRAVPRAVLALPPHERRSCARSRTSHATLAQRLCADRASRGPTRAPLVHRARTPQCARERASRARTRPASARHLRVASQPPENSAHCEIHPWVVEAALIQHGAPDWLLVAVLHESVGRQCWPRTGWEASPPARR